jgi:L-alanine-DL-glutamate epimerase-like enolase superfamily enzyme
MPWVSAVYQQRVEMDAQGQAIVPERPGWGYDFDPAVIRKYTLR